MTTTFTDAHLSIPVNYNGSIRTREDAQVAYESTGVGGVMVARGLLHNPGLFDDRRLGDPDVLTGKYNSIFSTS